MRTSWNELACRFSRFDHESEWTAWFHLSWPSELWKTLVMCLLRQGPARAVEVAVQQWPRQSRGKSMMKVLPFVHCESQKPCGSLNVKHTKLLGTWLELGAETNTCEQRRHESETGGCGGLRLLERPGRRWRRRGSDTNCGDEGDRWLDI